MTTKQQPIQSYISRGRLTTAQADAFKKHWKTWGVTTTALQHLDNVFGRHAPVILEIGCGTGEALLTKAIARVEDNFLGIEVYKPGIGRLFKAMADEEVSNIRVVNADVQLAIKYLHKAQLKEVFILFPDPWPKRKHWKRRLITADFLTQIAMCMKDNALLHLVTDWETYAREMEAMIENSSYFNRITKRTAAVTEEHLCNTRFARHAQREGREIYYIDCCRAID